MTRYLLALLALAVPGFAQFPAVGGAEVHWTARSRPIITATYEVLPTGTIVQEFEVVGLDAMDRAWAPAYVSTVRGAAQSQAIQLRGLPAGASWDDYRTTVSAVGSWMDGYGVENLTSADIGTATGQSNILAPLCLFDPMPATQGGRGVALIQPNIARAWNLGYIFPWDQHYDLAGTSGEIRQTFGSTSSEQEVTNWVVRRHLAERETVTLYFSTMLGSDFDAWPMGLRVDAAGEPLAKGAEIGQGHGGLWPWYHEFRSQSWRFTVRYEPVQ